jgi:hypothetical protein
MLLEDAYRARHFSGGRDASSKITPSCLGMEKYSGRSDFIRIDMRRLRMMLL